MKIMDFIWDTILTLCCILPLTISVAYFTLLERKLIAAIQRRKGPELAGPFGVLQPIADGIKLFTQEQVIPKHANKAGFIAAPILTLFLSLVCWSVVPLDFTGSGFDLEYSMLFIQAVSSLGVYSIIISGWTSSSKYATLSCLRGVAQFISYELCLGVCFLWLALMGGSLNIIQIWYCQLFYGCFCFLGFPVMVCFFISSLAETNRVPFDIGEAEGELVAGFHTEFSASAFALFFLGEYCNILLFSALIVIFFLGGWFFPFTFKGFSHFFPAMKCTALKIISRFAFPVKICAVCSLFIVVRSTAPRLRFDQVMYLCWKALFPFMFGYLFLFFWFTACKAAVFAFLIIALYSVLILFDF